MKQDYVEEEYPFLMNEIMEYINEIKSEDSSVALIDIIFDFCLKRGMDVELVGDAISNDVYFKSFLEKDCQLHRVLPGSHASNDIGEW